MRFFSLEETVHGDGGQAQGAELMTRVDEMAELMALLKFGSSLLRLQAELEKLALRLRLHFLADKTKQFITRLVNAYSCEWNRRPTTKQTGERGRFSSIPSVRFHTYGMLENRAPE